MSTYTAIQEIWSRCQSGSLQEAKKLADDLIVRAPWDPHAIMTKALVLAADGQVDAAISHQCRGMADQLVAHARTLENLHRNEEALQIAKVAFQVDPYNLASSDFISRHYFRGTQFDAKVSSLGYPSPFRFDTPNGVFFVPSDAPGDIVALRLKAGMKFQPNISSMASNYYRPGTAVIDVGANLGGITLELSRIVGESGQVISIEASPYMFRLLEMMTESNQASNVRPLNVAAFDKSGSSLTYPRPDLKRYSTYGSYGIDLSAVEGFKIDAVAIDDLEIGSQVSFIKVDIQGADLTALRGARKTILRDRPAVVFEYEHDLAPKFGDTYEDYEKFISDVGYRIELRAGDDILILPN